MAHARAAGAPLLACDSTRRCSATTRALGRFAHTSPRRGMGADVGACAGGDAGDASVAADLDVDALVAAATDPDLATQAERLRKRMGSGTSMLDLRAEKDFERRRFAGAVNIPFGDLDGHLHELPPRGTPLCVLLKQPDGEDDSATFEAQLRVFAADFKSRPWRVENALRPGPRERAGPTRPHRNPVSPRTRCSSASRRARASASSPARSPDKRGGGCGSYPTPSRGGSRASSARREQTTARFETCWWTSVRRRARRRLRGSARVARPGARFRREVDGAVRGARGDARGRRRGARCPRADLRVKTPGDVLALAEREAAGERAAAARDAARRPSDFLAVRYMNRPLRARAPRSAPRGRVRVLVPLHARR